MLILRNKKGQSTIEFILSFAITVGFVFSFYKIAILYTNGYLVHYATFMAGRSYMVFDNNASDPAFIDQPARQKAQAVFQKFNLTELLHDFDGRLEVNDPSAFNTPENALYIGVFAEYEDVLLTPIFGNKQDLSMRSDAYLGREPMRSECFLRICRAMGPVAGRGDYCEVHATLFDNGC
jgi:hypothetical protein